MSGEDERLGADRNGTERKDKGENKEGIAYRKENGMNGKGGRRNRQKRKRKEKKERRGKEWKG